MITPVDTVIVGKQAKKGYDGTVVVGDLWLFNQNRKQITSEADAIAAESIYFGVATKKVTVTTPTDIVAGDCAIEFSNEIKFNGRPKATFSAHKEPVEEKVTITLKDADVIVGHRYVLRIVYKDINEAPGQFTHTYEVIATVNTAKDLVEKLRDKINKHKNRRVEVSVVASASFSRESGGGNSYALVLTAMPKDDNEGVNSLNTYQQVAMDVTLYETIPGALLANQPKKLDNAVITKTPGNPGVGYWKIVRDAEVRNMGYKGHVFTDAYPAIKQNLKVVEGTEYDNITIESDNLYLSNDNQYIKTTPMLVEVYAPKLSELYKYVEAFITKKASAKAE